MIRELAQRGALIQSCTGSVDVGTKSKVKSLQGAEAGGHPRPLVLLLPELVPTPKCCQGQTSASPLLLEPPSTPTNVLHTSTFQHGNPGAAIAEVQPSLGGIEPELRLLLLAAGWTGPQGHFRVGLWAQRGSRKTPLSTHDGRAVRLSPTPTGRVAHPSPVLVVGSRERETASRHHGGKPLAGGWHPWGYWHEPSTAKGPGQGHCGCLGGFGAGIPPPHTH